MKVKCDHRSRFSNLSNWKEEAWKKSGLQRDSNPWPPRYRCDALPTELWSHTLGARSIYWVHIFSEMMWNPYLYCGCRWKWSVIKSNLRLPEKSPGFNGIRTHDLRDTGAMLHQLSYEATHWEQSIYWVHIFPCSEMMWNLYEIIHICTAVVDEIWIISYRFHIMRLSHFTFIYNRSTNMNYFI